MAVTVDEVKAHLRIQHDEEDGFILSLIAQAQAAAEDFCRVEFAEDAPQPVRLAMLLLPPCGARTGPFENLLYPYRDPDKMF